MGREVHFLPGTQGKIFKKYLEVRLYFKVHLIQTSCKNYLHFYIYHLVKYALTVNTTQQALLFVNL